MNTKLQQLREAIIKLIANIKWLFRVVIFSFKSAYKETYKNQ